MHPDLEPEERILPKEKFLSLKSLYYAQLFDLQNMEHLELTQESYLGNLTNHGESFTNLKRLAIEHAGTKDVLMLKAPKFLPKETTLDVFTIYSKAAKERAYALSDIIDNWEPAKAKKTLFMCSPSYMMDAEVTLWKGDP